MERPQPKTISIVYHLYNLTRWGGCWEKYNSSFD